MNTVRVQLPVHLQTLARADSEVRVEVSGDPTIAAVLDALEARYPALRGTIRDQATGARRAYIRYFAAGHDVSHEPSGYRLPEEVTAGHEVFRVLGAISGG